MPEQRDPELDAIETILGALETLDDASRTRVIAYVFQRLGFQGLPLEQRSLGQSPGPPDTPPLISAPTTPAATAPGDIRSLAERKAPRNVVDRVTLVAYYLSEAAPQSERKAEIAGADVTKYFKQAGFPIPASTRGALFAARDAGYLDTGSKRGVYRLNPVGHNRVVHSLPEAAGRGGTSRGKSAGRRRVPKKRAGSRNSARRKSGRVRG